MLIPQHTHDAKNSMLAFQMGVKQHTELLSASLVPNNEIFFLFIMSPFKYRHVFALSSEEEINKNKMIIGF